MTRRKTDEVNRRWKTTMISKKGKNENRKAASLKIKNGLK